MTAAMSLLTTYSWPGAPRLARVEVLAERAGAHTPSPHPLPRTLASSQPGSMRYLAIRLTETHYAPFAELTHTIRTKHLDQRSL
jgi:hypothetical protein